MAKNKQKKQTHTQEKKAEQVQNPALKQALATLKNTRTPENEQAMLKELTAAYLLIPARPQGTGQNARIQFVFVNTNDQRTFLPAFTDEQEAKKMKMPDTSGQKYIVRRITDLAALFKDPQGKAEGIVLDAMGVNIILPSRLILTLADAKNAAFKAGNPAVSPAAVQFTEPRIYPTAMVNAVHDAARGMEAIQQIFFKQMIAETGVSFALFVKTADGSISREIMEHLRETAMPLAKGLNVEILPWSEKMEQTVLKDSIALYDAELDI